VTALRTRLVVACSLLSAAAALAVRVDGLYASPVAPARMMQEIGAPFYYAGGERITLSRSPAECVVSFVPGGRDPASLIRSLFPGANVSEEIPSGGRVFHVVAVQDGAGPAIELVLARLWARRDVQFAGPVFYEPKTEARLIATDEIVVKLKPGGTRADVMDAASRHRLTITAMPGTSDEYLLRVSEPRSADILTVARALHESGRFVWAEPNFIRQFEKRRGREVVHELPDVHGTRCGRTPAGGTRCRVLDPGKGTALIADLRECPRAHAAGFAAPGPRTEGKGWSSGAEGNLRVLLLPR
jgi:hypothetical protein